MTTETKLIAVKILGKEYHVSCPNGKEHSLMDAAFFLDEKMQEIKKTGRVLGGEKIAIMAALNIAHTLTEQQSSQEYQDSDIEKRLIFLNEKIEKALQIEN